MRKLFLIVVGIIFCVKIGFSQTAPSHLKYFGFAIVDCLWDDPHDTVSTTNYISEVDSFSNLAQLCVYSYTDTVVNRVNLMLSHCVKPLLAIQSVFYSVVDTNAPSGSNLDLMSNFAANWNAFKTANSTILDSNHIGAFYVVDEPVWNGVSFAELDTVCNLIKADFPDIPLFFVEAYPALPSLQIPVAVDWVGFDRYGVFDPSTDPFYLADLAMLKGLRSAPHQKIQLVIDDQWLPYYGIVGYSPDTIAYMVQNYYNLAVSDTAVIGLIGYLWAGGLDDPGQLGVRNMPAGVMMVNQQIGRVILANTTPCLTGISYASIQAAGFDVFPNPVNAGDLLQIRSPNAIGEEIVTVYDMQGHIWQQIPLARAHQYAISVKDWPSGLYAFCLTTNKTVYTRTVIIQNEF